MADSKEKTTPAQENKGNGNKGNGKGGNQGKKPEKVKALQVSAKRDGFRRAGRPWHGTTNVALNDKNLTNERRKMLEAEPLLVVHEVQVEANEVEPYGVAPQG